ncbi:Hypothetical_protein [Hexamita inflata]|uniref:Hypothetical_protein n=1 Tax=Hexamita inflata TaxID=28002 RepID=A0AA86UJF0_9EUKA|nr:Hypothetical protein HINF_LOCUS29898 [Hexamita inflata]
MLFIQEVASSICCSSRQIVTRRTEIQFLIRFANSTLFTLRLQFSINPSRIFFKFSEFISNANSERLNSSSDQYTQFSFDFNAYVSILNLDGLLHIKIEGLAGIDTRIDLVLIVIGVVGALN